MKSLIEKLDLTDYVGKFNSFLAREKNLAMEGDVLRHFKFIDALSKMDFPKTPEVDNLDGTLIKLKKQGILKLDEIYQFVRIILYFNRLKSLEMKEPLASWIKAIEVPEDFRDIILFFDEDGEINLEREPRLYEISEAIKRNRVKVKEALNRIIHSSKMSQFLVDTQVHLYNLEESLLVRGGFSQVIDATVIGRSEGGFFYIVPKSIDTIKSKEDSLKVEREQIIWEYQKSFSATFQKWVRFLEFVNREFDRFDHYQARVNFARSFDYNFILPDYKSKNILLSEFAHPAISKPILLNISLEKPVMLITGVNAGGKTMLLKSILSALFMSKYLLPFRCNSSKTKIGHYKNIEAIIDDPQSVKNDISTFAGRMLEFSRLFRERDVIVGVDEIELGTDSDEAASLFRVILDELKARGITFVVTTHHKRLASLMAGDKDVELVAALYDEKERVPRYTFLQGSIGKSYAFETAWRYGIPTAVIEKAKELFGEDKERLNELIEKSTLLEAQMREKIEALESEIASVKREREHFGELKESLKLEYQKSISKLEQEYNSAKRDVLLALKEVESKKARQLLNQAHQKRLKSSEDSYEKRIEFEFKRNDRVEYKSKLATVLSIKSKKAFILLDDGLKIMVSLSDLKPTKREPRVTNYNVRVKVERPQKGSLSLKLLGKRVDEAIDEVDDFISNALLHNFSEVEIIHGTGSGILSKAISKHLKMHPKVKSFEKMKGNMGITVVNL